MMCKVTKMEMVRLLSRKTRQQMNKQIGEMETIDSRRPQNRPKQSWRDKIAKSCGMRCTSFSLARQKWGLCGETFVQQGNLMTLSNDNNVHTRANLYNVLNNIFHIQTVVIYMSVLHAIQHFPSIICVPIHILDNF